MRMTFTSARRADTPRVVCSRRRTPTTPADVHNSCILARNLRRTAELVAGRGDGRRATIAAAAFFAPPPYPRSSARENAAGVNGLAAMTVGRLRHFERAFSVQSYSRNETR